MKLSSLALQPQPHLWSAEGIAASYSDAVSRYRVSHAALADRKLLKRGSLNAIGRSRDVLFRLLGAAERVQLDIIAYNFARVINIVGVKRLLVAILA